jgi:hypothetical protein
MSISKSVASRIQDASSSARASANAKSAQAHVRDNYTYFAAENQIKTTEHFIESAATKSSFTGQPNEVWCDITLAIEE